MPGGPIRRELHKIRGADPGIRFESTHERHRIDNRALRIFVIMLGATLMLVAAVTFWMPGPNFVLVLAGLALVSSQWRLVARLLDRGEIVLRRWNDEVWDEMSTWKQRTVIGVAWLAFSLTIAAMSYIAWRQGLVPGWVPYLD